MEGSDPWLRVFVEGVVSFVVTEESYTPFRRSFAHVRGTTRSSSVYAGPMGQSRTGAKILKGFPS